MATSCNYTITATNVVKYLGVLIDSRLKFSDHANSVIKKANDRLRFLHRQGSCLNRRCRKLLCMALVQCLFDYSSSSWYTGLSKSLKKKLQITQNKMVRFMLMQGPRFHVGQEELSSLRMLSVEGRAAFARLNHTHKIFYMRSSPYLLENFSKTSEVHTQGTRSRLHNFYRPKCAASSSFCATAIQDWNALPTRLKSMRSNHMFKLELKKHLR